MPALSTVDDVWDTSILLAGEAVTPTEEKLSALALQMA